MFHGTSHHRRPDPLLLLVVIVLLGAAITGAASAGESINFFTRTDAGYRTPSQDSGLLLASMGHKGGVLNVSLTPPNQHPHGLQNAQYPAQQKDVLSEVFLFLRYPW
jgi:hypothetical protein